MEYKMLINERCSGVIESGYYGVVSRCLRQEYVMDYEKCMFEYPYVSQLKVVIESESGDIDLLVDVPYLSCYCADDDEWYCHFSDSYQNFYDMRVNFGPKGADGRYGECEVYVTVYEDIVAYEDGTDGYTLPSRLVKFELLY